MERVEAGELQVGAASRQAEGLYAPSWADRLTDWVRQLPIPSQLFYLGLALVLILLSAAAKWSDGTYPVGIFSPLLVMGAITPVYGWAFLHYLDNSAAAALDKFRPIMLVDEVEYNKIRYRLTTLPARPALIASAIGAVYGPITLLFWSSEEVARVGALTSPLASVFDVSFPGLGYMAAALIVYHTIHQLRLVSSIYTTCTRIDLFQLGSMYELSKLTARTAIGLGLISYAWFAVNVGLNTQTNGLGATSILEVSAFSLLVAVIFVWPLLDAHRLLQQEKESLQAENAKHLRDVIGELHRRKEAGEFAQMDGINKAMDSLMKEQTVLDKISTWPWQPETLRWLGTAVLLPVLIWLITRALERFVIF